MQKRHAELLPSVPGYVAGALVISSFLLGHFSQQAHEQLGKQAEVASAPGGQVGFDRHLQRRVLRISEQSTTTTSSAAGDAQGGAFDEAASSGQAHRTVAPKPPANPLDTPELERYLLGSTNLLQLRPPIEPALSGDNFTRIIPFQILSWYPRLVVFPAFVDPERCRLIMEHARDKLSKSGLAYRPGEKEDQQGQQTRTSSGVFLASAGDKSGSLAWVEERIAAATLYSTSLGEPFNLLRYEHLQHYDSHMDSFDPKEYGPQPSQRIATMLIYLSDVEEGGETIFKHEGKGNETSPIKDWRNCNDGQGYKYKPRQGDAVLFYDTHLNGDLDKHSLHGGCPVVKGEKWVITRWIRSKPTAHDTAAEMEGYARKARGLQ